MDRYTEKNIRTVKVGMKSHLDITGKKILLDMLRQVGRRMIAMIDGAFTPIPPYESTESGNNAFPVWRGHMRDATGLAIYDDGLVIAYFPTKKGLKYQDYEGEKVFGYLELRQAIAEGVNKFTNGLWIVLFSAVPYALDVNSWGSPHGRGIGYFDTLSDDMLKDILMGLEVIDL